MLVNVRFFNLILKRFSYTIVFVFYTIELLANEKVQILSKLNDLNSLEFTFTQSTNNKIEKGIKILMDNIDYWKKAPVWTPKTINKATSLWFKYLGK